MDLENSPIHFTSSRSVGGCSRIRGFKVLTHFIKPSSKPNKINCPSFWVIACFYLSMSHGSIIAHLSSLCDSLIYFGILQARILEWVPIPFSRGSSQPRNETQVPHIAGRFFTIWATRKVPYPWLNTVWCFSLKNVAFIYFSENLRVSCFLL